MSRNLLLGLTALRVMTSSPATAGPPDPAFSTIPNVVYCPLGDLTYRCVIRSGLGTPCIGVVVDLSFDPGADAAICWCDDPAQPHPVMGAVTDLSGTATFFIRAGGCMLPENNGGDPVVDVYASGLFMRTVISTSPDAVDNGGLLPGEAGYVKECLTGLSDAVYHTPPIKTATYQACTDFNGDGSVSLFDAVILTPHLKNAHRCVPQM